MSKNKISLNSFCFILIWIILLSGYPFVFPYMIGYPALMPTIIAFLLLLILSIKYKLKITRTYFAMITLLVLFFLFKVVLHGDSSYMSNIIQILIVVFVVMASKYFVTIEKMTKSYIYILSLIVALGVIGWFTVFIWGYEPFFRYSAHDGRSVGVYLFTVCNTYVPVGDHPIIRYSGIFDEPGTLSFFSMIALCLNRLFMNNRKIEYILLIGPILTFSMAHIITSFLYIVLFKMKKMSTIIVSLTIGIILVLVVNSLKGTDYERIYELSMARFEYSEERGLEGNTRAILMENAQEQFSRYPIWGGGKTSLGNDDMSSNPFTILAFYGIIGYVIIHIMFIYICLKAFNTTHPNKWVVLKCILIIFVNFQQRPFSTNIFYFTSIFYFILMAEYIMVNKVYNKMLS